MKGLVWAVCLFGVGGLAQLAATSARPRPKQDLPTAGGRVRTYYIAAEETEWDYAPLGIDMMTGKPFEGTAAAYTQPGPNHIGHVYRKAVYREYTDATFATRKPRPPQDEYLGLLGPILRAEVGDTIKVVFKNNASRPYSMHAPDDASVRGTLLGPAGFSMPGERSIRRGTPGYGGARGDVHLRVGRAGTGGAGAGRSQLDRLGVPLARQRIQRRGFRPGGGHHRDPARPG